MPRDRVQRQPGRDRGRSPKRRTCLTPGGPAPGPRRLDACGPVARVISPDPAPLDRHEHFRPINLRALRAMDSWLGQGRSDTCCDRPPRHPQQRLAASRRRPRRKPFESSEPNVEWLAKAYFRDDWAMTNMPKRHALHPAEVRAPMCEAEHGPKVACVNSVAEMSAGRGAPPEWGAAGPGLAPAAPSGHDR